MCEEYESYHDRTGGPLWEENGVLRLCQEWSRQTCFLNDDPAQEEVLLQRYRERIEKLSQQDRLRKFCTDAGFLTTVEIGQYFMTKDTEELSQFTDSVACREYTLPRDESSSDPKGWIRGSTKIGPVLEVTTSYLQGKYGVEIRIKSVNKENCHSWVRISHVLNELVTNLNNKDQDDNEQETSEMQFEEHALKLNAGDFASQSKVKAKPQKRDSASSSTRTILIGWENLDWCWTTKRFALRLSSVEETDSSSSSWKSTSRQWWSDWFLEKRRLSLEPFCAFSTFVWWKVEEQHGRRRRTKEKISLILQE